MEIAGLYHDIPERSSLVFWFFYKVIPMENTACPWGRRGDCLNDFHFVIELWPHPSPAQGKEQRSDGLIIWSLNTYVAIQLDQLLNWLLPPGLWDKGSYHIDFLIILHILLIWEYEEGKPFSYISWDLFISTLIKTFLKSNIVSHFIYYKLTLNFPFVFFLNLKNKSQ